MKKNKGIVSFLFILSILILTACSNKSELYSYNYSNGTFKAEINEEYIYLEDNNDFTNINFLAKEKENKSFVSIAGINEVYNTEQSKELINSYKTQLNENYQTSQKNVINERDNIIYSEYSLIDLNDEIFQVKTKIIKDDNSTYMIVMFNQDSNVKNLKDSFNILFESLTIK